MPRFLSPIFVKQEIVTGNEIISGNETILGVTSGKESYWLTVNSELSVSSDLGYFDTLSSNYINSINLETYSISSTNLSSSFIDSVIINALTGYYQTLTASNVKSDYFIGDGSKLTGILASGGYSTDIFKLPLTGGTLTGGLTGTEAYFNLLSSAIISGTYYGDGSNLTGVLAYGGTATDSTKLPLSGGVLTNGLTGTEAYFNLLSSSVISGTYYGDGSKLTGVIAAGGTATDPTKLPLSGGILTGTLIGTEGYFNTLSSTIISGTYYGDGSFLTGVIASGGIATDSTKLALTGGILTGDLTIFGGLTALSGSTFVNTIFTTTSALSIVNNGLGPALYVYQGSGAGDIASFYDGDGIEVLHIGNALNPVSDGVVGIKTSEPNKTLTVIGDISATNSIWGNSFYGNADNLSSIKWDSTYTTVNSNSATWNLVTILSTSTTNLVNLTSKFDNTYTTVNNNSANWTSVYNNVNTNSASWVATVNLSSSISDLRNLTAGYTSTSNTVNSNSGKWENTYTNLNSNSSKWDSIYTTVNSNSSTWNLVTNLSTITTNLVNLTAGFSNTSNTVNSNSAKWENTYSTVNTYSGSWVTTTNLSSSVSDLRNLTAGYTSTSNTVNSNSAKWESVYTNVNSNSASYVTLSGTQILTNKTIIDWMTLVRGYNTTPTFNTTFNNGDIYNYVYNSSPTNITYYRYISNDGSQDAFYSYFSGNTLSGLIASKSITIY